MPYRLVLVIIPLAALTAWTIWSATRPRTFTSLPRGVTIAVAVLLGVLLVQQSVMEYRWVSTERRLTDAIQPITGAGGAVHCQRWTEAFFYARAAQGFVDRRSDGSADPTAMITWERCQDLRNWLEAGSNAPTEDQLIALHLLTHEAVHVTGNFDEAGTECIAIQTDAWLAERLGMSRALADDFVARYLADVYPRVAAGYRSPECVPGGDLDLFPNDDQWPRATTPFTTARPR